VLLATAVGVVLSVFLPGDFLTLATFETFDAVVAAAGGATPALFANDLCRTAARTTIRNIF
jgi:hypothetical protein